MNRIDKLFATKENGVLSVYFTAGYPTAGSTTDIIKTLADSGVDMIEIGIPFSDPLADGPVIQKSSTTALKNGMSVSLLFSQLEGIRNSVNVPLILMGYLNPVLKYGVENFCQRCSETGIDGVILPDLPPEVYIEKYRTTFKKYGIYNILLISPRTDTGRIRFIDTVSEGFIYMVSASSVTGIKKGFTDEQREYFKRIREMNLKNPLLIGFGISSHETFTEACKNARGAIVGSAFIKMLGEKGFSKENIKNFIENIKSTSKVTG